MNHARIFLSHIRTIKIFLPPRTIQARIVTSRTERGWEFIFYIPLDDAKAGEREKDEV